MRQELRTAQQGPDFVFLQGANMFNRRVLIAFFLTSILGACATAPQNQTMTLQPVAADKANVYVYRKSAFFGTQGYLYEPP